MEVEGDNNITWFTFTGEEEIPDDATHVFVHVRVVSAATFSHHPNIVEVVCHEDVEEIEVYAFECCPSLTRAIMPGVLIVEDGAFSNCEALMYVECGKLVFIRTEAFRKCKSLRSIDLSSVAVAENGAFIGCEGLRDAKFSSELDRIEGGAFHECTSLERITIPLKDGMITETNIFMGCTNLKQVHLIGGELHETIAALHLEEWRNDMNEGIDFINRILPKITDGTEISDNFDPGKKTRVIQTWILVVLHQINHYKAEHQRVLDEAATTLQLALPRDIVMNNVLPFLDLPSYS